MENIIPRNYEFVNSQVLRKITSKVPENQGHARFVLSDRDIRVRTNGNTVNMRCVLLTDKENSLYKRAMCLNNLEFLDVNVEKLYGLEKTVRNYESDKPLPDKDFQAVPSPLIAPNIQPGTTPLLTEYEENHIKTYVIGFDTEWVEGQNGKRHILSYQLSMFVGDSELLEFILFPEGHRLTLSRLLSIFTQELRYVLGIDIGASATSDETVKCYLVAHYSIVDLTTLFDGKKILRNSDTVRRTQATATEPLYAYVYDKYYNYKQLWVVWIRDTGLLAPSGSSLKQLACSMGKIKLELPPGYGKEEMGKLLQEQEEEFMLYAANDASLALEYVHRMYPEKDIPVTLGSEGATIFREKIMEINGWDVKQFDYYFRGLQTIKVDNKKRLEARPEAVAALEMANHAYYGGRNECFIYGIHPKEWNDYDLSGAYPTAMALLPNPDFSRISSLTGDIVSINPLDYIFGLVDFEFPDDVMYPCLPVKDKEGRGLIFPRKGRTFASAPELYAALKMGAKLRWVQPAIQVGTTGEYHMQEALTDLLKARAEAKKLYGKGSLQEVKLKEIVNSIYGKTAQGLARKRSYSTRSDSVNDMPPSIITQPLIASMTTSTVRAIVSVAMHQLHLQGYRIASVTTDGFLTDAPFEVLDSLKLYGFKAVYEAVRNMMVGDPTMWEIKHKAQILVMITTRGGFGIGRIGDNKLPVAKSGYKPEEGFKEKYGDDAAVELARRFLERKGKMEMSFNKLPSPKEYVRKDADGLGVFQKKYIQWEYDLKRKPVNLRMEKITIGDKTYEHLAFDTEPWDTIEDFIDARAVKKDHPELYPLKALEKGNMLLAMIKEKEAARKAGMLIQSADKGGVYRTAVISYLRDLAAGREPMPEWMQGKSYRQLVEAFNERLKSLNVTLTVDDFKKAKQRSNKGRLENSEALEVVKSLLK